MYLRANIICKWFDGQQFYHEFPGLKIVRKEWSGKKCDLSFQGNTISLSFNSMQNDFDLVVDLGCLFSEQSRIACPEKRALALTEPSMRLGLSKKKVDEINKFYPRMIMGWHNAIRNMKQYVFWNATSKWVIEENVMLQKKFGVSGFISNKMKADIKGYALRYEIVLNQHSINIPSLVYNFTGMWRGQRIEYPAPQKDVGMNHMFHLAIENDNEPGYFTEKLIDCFVARVIPLYFGAPDIGNFFDMNGIITLDPKRWLDQINSLTEKDFESRRKAIERNYEASRPYWSAIRSLSKILCTRTVAFGR